MAAAAAQSARSGTLKSPSVAEIGRAAGAIRDGEPRAQTLQALAPDGFWGGDYRTSAGEKVTIYASNRYPVDPALGQRWANFLSTLVHGPELSTVTVLLAPPAQIERFCGSDAIACYSARGGLLYTPGEDPSSDFSAEAVITHEYGHHIAANRSNAPWDALDWGPKRWASAMQVCVKARRGDLAPGAEDPVQYEVNPGEGWAEAYRLLNQRRLGLPESPWEIVSDALYPSAAALSAAEQDVTSPWSAAAATTRTTVLTRKVRSRTFTVATPLDGSLKVTLRPSAGLRVAVDVYASATRVARATGGPVARAATICGARTYKVRVTALRGRGSVALTVAQPS